MRTVQEKIEILLRGIEEVIPKKDFISLIEKKQKLTIKAGFDPTSPDLHLGHTVLINKLKQFQDLGHKAILLIGDFTAIIGDPTGRNKTRPQLSISEAKNNSESYVSQASKNLYTSQPGISKQIKLLEEELGILKILSREEIT